MITIENLNAGLKKLHTDRQHSLFSPLIDFLTVGGLSYIFIAAISIYPISLGLNLTIALGLAYVINDPHFLSSYQLFYHDFKKKIAGEDLTRFMQLRYIFAGILIPALIVFYFVILSWSR